MAVKDDELCKSSEDSSSFSGPSTDSSDIFEDLDGLSTASGKSVLGKLWHYIKTIRMEPGLLLYMTASVMGNIMASDLQIDRACRINLGYNDTICDGVMST